MDNKTIFLTTAAPRERPAVRLLKDSLRSFGGDLAEAPLWIFTEHPDLVRRIEDSHTRVLPLTMPDQVRGYHFGKKVAACARAEVLAPAGTRSLIWIDPSILMVQTPELFKLGPDYDAAFRPVHIRNIGLPPSTPLDAYWQGIYSATGLEEVRSSVTSFVDGQVLRTYFNTHAFAVNPALGLMQRWYELFQQLVMDAAFQSTTCKDEPHRIFLFQALLSALVVKAVGPEKIQILPPTYNYPYHLQEQIPSERRLLTLNETICFTYEDHTIHPDTVTGIEVREPLRTWLADHTSRK